MRYTDEWDLDVNAGAALGVPLEMLLSEVFLCRRLFLALMAAMTT